jgi:ceramide glucosyltransferase
LINPKLWKLQRAAKRATSSFFCVLDDDTLLPASSAAALVTEASMHTIATGLPCYQDDGTTASGLLAQFVNNNSIFTYLGTTKLLHPFTLNGMGYVLDSKALHALGDFSPILHEMTDDLALATLVLKNRGTICQSSAPLIVDTKVLSLSHYFRLMHRWYLFTLLLLKKQQRSSRIIIFSLHGAPPVLLVILFMLTLYAATPEAVITLLALLAVRGIILTLMLHHFFHRHLHRPLLSILSEIFQPVHLVHALVSHTIHWRTRRYHVRDTSDFSSI